jgi:hypothetical protein
LDGRRDGTHPQGELPAALPACGIRSTCCILSCPLFGYLLSTFLEDAML